jgi:hypothetical protein
MMPEEDRKWLEQELIASHFSDYDGLAQALAERGYEISRAAVGRFGKDFKEHCEKIKRSTDMAVILSQQLGDDENALGDAAIRTMQSELYQAMQDYDWSQVAQMNPNELSLSVARLSRAGVNQKKWMSEVQEKMAAAKKLLAGVVNKGGLSEEALAQIEEAAGLL